MGDAPCALCVHVVHVAGAEPSAEKVDALVREAQMFVLLNHWCAEKKRA